MASIPLPSPGVFVECIGAAITPRTKVIEFPQITNLSGQVLPARDVIRLGREKGPVVINMSTSRVVEDLAARFGVPCHRSAVGEANVADRMLQVS